MAMLRPNQGQLHFNPMLSQVPEFTFKSIFYFWFGHTLQCLGITPGGLSGPCGVWRSKPAGCKGSSDSTVLSLGPRHLFKFQCSERWAHQMPEVSVRGFSPLFLLFSTAVPAGTDLQLSTQQGEACSQPSQAQGVLQSWKQTPELHAWLRGMNASSHLAPTRQYLDP